MENKYYTPDIEDFYIGYEFEILPYNENLEIYDVNTPWEKRTLRNGLSTDIIDTLHDGFVRTKYLDKEDIESLGWKYNEEYDVFELKYVNLQFWIKEIQIYNTSDSDAIMYEGPCKSINELKTLMRFLNIK